jgi:hypothetical protein
VIGSDVVYPLDTRVGRGALAGGVGHRKVAPLAGARGELSTPTVTTFESTNTRSTNTELEVTTPTVTTFESTNTELEVTTPTTLSTLVSMTLHRRTFIIGYINQCKSIL